MLEGYLDDESSRFRYFASEHSIYLSSAWFQQPMFYPKANRFVNYAVIGAVLGALMFEAVGRSARNHDGDGNNKSWWGEEMALAEEEQQECFKREYFDVSDGDPSPSLLDEIWAITEGIKLVWEQIVAPGMGESSVEINGKAFTWRQLFFLRFCSVWCDYAGTPAENAWRCNVPLRHISGFAYNFNCSQADAMRYRERCSSKLPCEPDR
ncbi:unnamed protein product [Ixodes hexagonus]